MLKQAGQLIFVAILPYYSRHLMIQLSVSLSFVERVSTRFAIAPLGSRMSASIASCACGFQTAGASASW